jgi:hypothetical protein
MNERMLGEWMLGEWKIPARWSTGGSSRGDNEIRRATTNDDEHYVYAITL